MLVRVLTILGLWAVIFTGLWAILDPLGGMELLTSSSMVKWTVYGLSLLLSLALAGLVVVLRSSLGQRKELQLSNTGASRMKIDYIDFLRGSTTSVRVLGISLPTFALEHTIAFLVQLVQQGVSVRIIIANPFSPDIFHRPQQLYSVAPHVEQNCAASLAVFLRLREHSLSSTERARFGIRLLTNLSAVGIVAGDKKILWSPYLATKTGASSPYLVHDAQHDPFAQEVINHFDWLWENQARDVTVASSVADIRAFVEEDGLVPHAASEIVQTILAPMFEEQQ